MSALATELRACSLAGTRLALVTGASSGIGRAVATELARHGWGTILIARRADALRELADTLRTHAPSFPVPLDLGDSRAIDHTLAAMLGPGVRIPLLINNAGFGLYRSFLEHTRDDHHAIMQVNYFAPLRLISAILPRMLNDGGGRIINILSMSAKMGPWGHSAYAASKAALAALGECLEAEYAPQGVRVSGVFPGLIDTPYFDKPDKVRLRQRMRPRMISAERCARRIVRLVDRPRLWTCIPAHYRALDAIAAIAPTLAHRMVRNESRVAPETPSPRVAAESPPC